MLVLFDVDGTLTETSALEGVVYERTFEATFGTPLPTTDWSAYANETDRGVAQEAIQRLRLAAGRLAEFEARLVEAIRRELASVGAAPVPGAREVFGVIEAAGHRVAVATGGLDDSARAKLAAAGIDLGGRVLVGSEFDPSRAAILHEARRRAGEEGPAVYVGDGSWDLRAAGAAGMGFVGVDPSGAGRLRAAGAGRVVRDFVDRAPFLAALEEAAGDAP